jgi:tape measure domain-containing protein
VQFANSFGEGAGSIGLGRVVAGWRKEIAGSGGGALNTIGFLAGKSLSAGLTAAAGAGVAGIGLALTKGFERLEKIDSATSKLNQMNEVAKRMSKPLIDVQKTVKAVKDSVDGTPYSLDAAFSIAVQAIGSGSKDIGKFMKDVTDAAGFAGDDLGHMGLVLTQVLSKGKADGGDMMQLMEAGLPAKSWIEDSYNLTSDQFEKMQKTCCIIAKLNCSINIIL